MAVNLDIDFKKGIKIIEEEIINKILEYLKNGVFSNNTSGNFNNAYSIVYSLSGKGDYECKKLFLYHNQTIYNYILECKKKLISENNINLIDNFLVYIKKINFLIYWMSRIFTYLDRFYIKSMIVKKSLSQAAMDICKSNFFDEIKKDIFIELDKLINEDRKGNKESRRKIKNIMLILKDFDMEYPKIVKENNKFIWIKEENKYEEYENEQKTVEQDLWFNEYFIKDTEKYLKKKSNKDFLNMPLSKYILSQIKFLEEENERINEYINPKYHNKINELNYQYLIINGLENYGSMEIVIKNLLKSEDYESLINLSKLSKLIPNDLDPIAPVFASFIRNKYNEKFNNEELLKNQIPFISELIKFKKEIDSFIRVHFKNNDYFKNIKDKGLNLLFRKDIFAKQLSNYVDYCMRFGFKCKSSEEIESTLDDIIGLFHYFNSKLVFQIESNKKMSERLLKNATLSIIYEKKFISKLGQEIGISNINKMKKMIDDLEKSKANMELYKSLSHKGSPNDIKLDITVISQSDWEINKSLMEKINIPKFLSVCLEDYENFYLNKYKSQQLIWCLGLSKIEINYLYLEQKYISISTLPQLLILLLLEQKSELSLQNISDLLGFKINIIINDIQGLVYNPSFNPHATFDKGIIKGSFKGNAIEFKASDTIFINRDFSCNKIKISTIPLKQKQSVSQRKEQEIEDSRMIKRYQDNILQATITRIMKSRIGQKTNHVWLLNETDRQIDLFKAQPQQIKENIEKLIEKNIIKRSRKNGSIYEYIA